MVVSEVGMLIFVPVTEEPQENMATMAMRGRMRRIMLL
jgi:hypothetical protein